MNRLNVLFAGSGEFGLPTLEALLDRHHILSVISQEDRPAGRGRKLTPTPVAQFAIDHKIPLIRTSHIEQEILPAADVMVVIAFGQKIPPQVVNAPRLGSINLHASILPRHRGASPINHAILSGDTMAGNSVIRLAERMDAGAVLGHSRRLIAPLETAGELHNNLSADGPELVLSVLDQLEAGTAVEVPQDEASATHAPKLSRLMASLDFSQPADQLACRIRGLFPWPGCRVNLLDENGLPIARLTLVKAQPVADNISSPDVAHPAGHIFADGTVQTGRGRLEIDRLQPEGRRPMAMVDFRNGHPWPVGGRLVAMTDH